MAATVIAAAYADVGEAEAALERVRRLRGVEDAAVVARDAEGRVELRQTRQPAVGEGVVAGGTIGLVAGFVFGGPVLGALVGLAGGGGLAVRDRGVPDERMRSFGDALEPGRAAVFALAADGTAVERVRLALAPWRGELLLADLSDD